MKSVEDLPADLSRAIYHANRVLDWQENLMSEEVPPPWMWLYEEELDTWFERVQQERDARYSGSGDSGGDSDGTMMSNEYAAGRRG